MFLVLLGAVAASVGKSAYPFAFAPQPFLAGGWREEPWMWLSPLISAFLARDFLTTAFNLIFLLIAGRFVEKAVRPLGLGILFVAGAYGGALARLILTPGSFTLSAGADAAVFAVIGAYLMLYGVPNVFPNVTRGHSRSVQIAILAAIWMAMQVVFALVAGGFELSETMIKPLGGLVAGVALARPLLAWTYRKA